MGVVPAGPWTPCWVLCVGPPCSWHGPVACAEIRKLTGHLSPASAALLRWGVGVGRLGGLSGSWAPPPPHPLPSGPRTSQSPSCEGLAAPETSSSLVTRRVPGQLVSRVPRPGRPPLPGGPHPAQPPISGQASPLHIPGPPSTCPHRPLGSGGPTKPALLAALLWLASPRPWGTGAASCREEEAVLGSGWRLRLV